MTDVAVWGLLPKAQDDGTTIDEAITAAIAAHESDPEAHMGVGESIDVHRKNEILDHPAGSVVADKAPSFSMAYQSFFEALTGFDVSGNVLQYAPGVVLAPNGGAGSEAIVQTAASTPSWPTSYALNFANAPMFQINLTGFGDVNGLAYFGWGDPLTASNECFFGFKYLDGTYYGAVIIYVSGGSPVTHTVSLFSEDNMGHILRAFVDPATNDLVFFVDGVEIDRIVAADYYADAAGFGNKENIFYLYAKKTGADYPQFWAATASIGNTPS